ncbi:MAG TPA: ABC transporter substrate-binding protein, partial [Acidimicrobiales bacterium]|nr:ABC transporter substrate-binding protein [Acidimicrobiales bacterium]
TSLASSEYTQLITQDHVDLAISDFGSVLTSVGVPVAQENSALLFDPTATTPSFFTESIFGNGNPDLVLTSLPSSAIWPNPLAAFLVSKGVKKVAIVQSANDFDAAQATTVENQLSAAGIVPVFNDTVQTSTTDYSSIVSQIEAANPDAVLQFGYGTNDVPFLAALNAASYHPKLTFTIFPGENIAGFEAQLPQSAMQWTYTYVAPPYLAENQVNFGMTTPEFMNAYQAANPGSAVNFLNIAGYQAGLIVQATLENSPALTPIAMRITVQKLSGHLQTIEGTFAIDQNGSQVGLYQPIGQIVPDGSGGLTLNAVFPPKYATAPAAYPAPNMINPAVGTGGHS